MGASSVTGVGNGSAQGGIKGPHNNRNVYVSKLTPHVVAAGIVTCASNVATVTFPTPLDGAPTKYAVMLTVVDSAVNATETVVTAKNGSTTFTSFEIAATDSTQVVQWAVISVGNV